MNAYDHPPPPANHFALRVNMIWDGAFHKAGEHFPLSKLKDLPPNLRIEENIIRHSNNRSAELEPESDNTANFVLGTHYQMRPDGTRGRALLREASRLNAIADQEDAIAEQWQQFNDDSLSPEAQADAEEQHRLDVEKQKMEAEVRANHQDDADKIEIAEPLQYYDITASPPAAAEWHPESKPTEETALKRKLKTRYVRRGSQYHRARNLKTLRIGEPVFCKEGEKFVEVGKVNHHRKLPLIYMEENKV